MTATAIWYCMQEPLKSLTYVVSAMNDDYAVLFEEEGMY